MREASLTKSDHSMSVHDEKFVPFCYAEHPNSEDEVNGEELSVASTLIHSDYIKRYKILCIEDEQVLYNYCGTDMGKGVTFFSSLMCRVNHRIKK